MLLEVYKKDSPLAKELIEKWGEKYAKYAEIKKELAELKKRMVKEIAPYKVGDVIRTVKDGKEFIVSEISISDYHLNEGGYKTGPYISFEYQTKAIRKDGMPSRNHTHIPSYIPTELTGRRFNFVTNQFE